MRYFARYDSDGNLVSLGTVSGNGKIEGEITATEYDSLRASIPKPEPVEMTDPVEEVLKILRGETE